MGAVGCLFSVFRGLTLSEQQETGPRLGLIIALILKRGTFIEHFTCMISCNPHNNPVRYCCYQPHFSEKEIRALGLRLNTLPEIT